MFVGCDCFKFKRLHKHNAKKTYFGDMKCDSKHEAKCAADLNYLKMAGQIKDFRRGKTIRFIINDVLITSYTPDFEVDHLDDTLEIVEAKGRFLLNDRCFRIITHLMEAIYLKENPTVKYRIVVN